MTWLHTHRYWLARRSTQRVAFDAQRCDRCGDCVAVCPEAQVLDFRALTRAGFVDSGECSNCARCLEVCPRDAFHFGLRSGRSAATRIREGDRHATQDAA